MAATSAAPTPDAVPGNAGIWWRRQQASFTGNNTVGLLRGGDELFPAQCEAISNARHDVWLASYIFNNDTAGQRTVRALLRAARRGARVRVVVDGFGSRANLPWLTEQFLGSAVALAVFRPIDGLLGWMRPGQLQRLHQKLCVVDSEHAFVGGINIIDDRIDLGHGVLDAPRLDFAVSLAGPVVAAVEQTCRAVWTRAWLGRDFREEFVAIVRSAEPVERGKRWLRQLRMPKTQIALEAVAELPAMRAAFVLRDNLRSRRTIERAYVDAITSAQNRVDLISPYFYPGSTFRRALCDTAARGVKVRLLLQGKADYRIATLAAQVLYDELLAHGVCIYEYTPAFLHAKVALVDQHWATVGSSNIDPLSLLLNLEANVIVLDQQFNAALAAQFEEAVAVSRQVDAKDPTRRSGWTATLRRAVVAWGAYVYLRVAGATGKY